MLAALSSTVPGDIVAAGAACINTGSNSSRASLQTTAVRASRQDQAINESEQNGEAESMPR